MTSERVLVRNIKHYVSPFEKGSDLEILQLFFDPRDEDLAESLLDSHCPRGRSNLSPPAASRKITAQVSTAQQVLPLFSSDEVPTMTVRPIYISGSSGNRVDLVFFADGYTAAEAQKFFDDAFRLARDVSQNQTFASVAPLLNFWAAFIPSAESGIGSRGKSRNTTFGLYRDGTELRAVYPGKIDVARAAASSLGNRCDYPILLANDPMYGGLGGEFTITTASSINGALVLRHELGHSIIDVGEEYDGGFAYFGPNSQRSVSNVKWDHWFSHPYDSNRSHSHETPRVERSSMPFQAYPWIVLSDNVPSYSANFTSSGDFARFLLMFSVSGVARSSDLFVLLDGVNLEFTPRADIGLDRWHYEIQSPAKLQRGTHSLTFFKGPTARDAQVQVCSVEVLEFGDEGQFNTTPGFVSLFPTYSLKNKTTFRPTNDGCLMRRVTDTRFCAPCTEGLWLQLLKQVDLIDGVNLRCHATSAARATITLTMLPLGHLRQVPIPGETFAIEWWKDGRHIPHGANATAIDVEGAGVYEVEARLSTPEVRKDPTGLLTSRWAMIVLSGQRGGCPTMSVGDQINDPLE